MTIFGVGVLLLSGFPVLTPFLTTKESVHGGTETLQLNARLVLFRKFSWYDVSLTLVKPEWDWKTGS